MYELSREIWQAMCTNKLRTILTGISVAWGIFMLVLLLSISKGVANTSDGFAQQNDPYRITLWGGKTSTPYAGMKEGRDIQLRTKHLDMLKNANPQHIDYLEGSLSFSQTISTPINHIGGNAKGVYPAYLNSRYTIMHGRNLTTGDLLESRKVALLHKSNAKVLFDDEENVVGRVVKIGDLAFTIVGVYDHNWEKATFIPYTTAKALNGFDPPLESIDIHIKNINSVEDSEDVLKLAVNTLSRAEKFDDADKSAIYYSNRYSDYIQSMQATDYLTIAMWIIGILTLITGIVGVSNIMFVSVRERTHEIGIRRAIGAKPRSVLGQVVIESVALTTVFGYIGIVMGVMASEIAKKVLSHTSVPLRPEVDIAIAFQVLAALIIAGALAGIFPALRATKVKPVEALAEE